MSCCLVFRKSFILDLSGKTNNQRCVQDSLEEEVVEEDEEVVPLVAVAEAVEEVVVEDEVAARQEVAAVEVEGEVVCEVVNK